MLRLYNFIQGDGHELRWSPVIQQVPKKHQRSFYVSSYLDITKTSKYASPLPDERVIFLSEHGHACHLFSDPSPAIPEVLSTLITALPSKNYIFHLSGSRDPKLRIS